MKKSNIKKVAVGFDFNWVSFYNIENIEGNIMRVFFAFVFCLIMGVAFADVNANINVKLGSITNKIAYTNSFCVYVYDIKHSNIVYSYDKADWKNTMFPAGSLIKPFTIIAKFKNHQVDVLEQHYCGAYTTNTSDEKKCWLLSGHKHLNLIQAIAYSCNTYFYYFSRDIDFKLFIDTLKDYGFIRGRENFGKQRLTDKEKIMAKIGKMYFLKAYIVDIIESYVTLLSGENTKISWEVQDIILDGMHQSYSYGTVSKSRTKLKLSPLLPIYTKTGTGVFIEDGDVDIRRTNGFFVGIYNFEYLVFVGACDATGSGEASYIGLAVMTNFFRVEKNEIEEIDDEL